MRKKVSLTTLGKHSLQTKPVVKLVNCPAANTAFGYLRWKIEHYLPIVGEKMFEHYRKIIHLNCWESYISRNVQISAQLEAALDPRSFDPYETTLTQFQRQLSHRSLWPTPDPIVAIVKIDAGSNMLKPRRLQ